MSNTAITHLGGVVRHSLAVPMRDGVRLATDLYLPENLGPYHPGPLPVLLERTPYGKNEETRRERSAANPHPMRRGEVAGAITAHSGPLQGCDTLPLGRLRYLATASPGFVAHWLPEDVSRAAMTRAPALTFSDQDRLQADWLRQHLGPGVAFPTHRMASSQAFVDGALAGLGWGMNPLPLVAAHLEAGRLVELLPGTPLDVALHWQFARRTAPALAGLTKALKRAAEGGLLAAE